MRHILSTVIQPNSWTLDTPAGRPGTGQPNQLGRWNRTCQETPVLSSRIMRTGGSGDLESSYIIQYGSTFRFPGNLHFHQLPMRGLTDILEYVIFLIQTHPDLLTSSPAEIDRMVGWIYPHVDPCLYPDPSNSPTQDELQVSKLKVNGFIPVVEMDGSKDWVIMLVWSVEVSVSGSTLAYRKYFESNLLNQIDTEPNLTGGLTTRPDWSIGLGVFDLRTGSPAFTPQPGVINPN